VRVPGSEEIPARGSALFGAVAGGAFPDIESAVAATRPPTAQTYTPDPAAHEVYERLYAIYRPLYGLLGNEHGELLHQLKRLRAERSAA
jgi:L-ribulokinase